MFIPVFCVASESNSSGLVNWHTSQEMADKQYETFVGDNELRAETVTRFDIKVDDEANPDVVTHLADTAMWEMTYVPIRQRFGTDGVNLHHKHLACEVA